MDKESYVEVLVQEINHLEQYSAQLKAQYGPLQSSHVHAVADIHAQQDALLREAGIAEDYETLAQARRTLRQELEEREALLDDACKQASHMQHYLMTRVREILPPPSPEDVSEDVSEDA